jgi:hypothetical protein
LEHDLNDLIAVAQHDCLASTLPLLDVGQWILCFGPQRSSVFREGELKGLELLVAIQVALEVLKKDDFLVDCFWELKEIKLMNLFFLLILSSTRTVNVVKMEQIRVRDDLGRIIEQHIRTIAQLVTKTVL